MWKMYDEMIQGIPENLSAKRVVAGNFWTVVESELGAGVAGTVKEITRPPIARFKLEGAPLKQVAELAKSWNMIEASIGVAAINAYYNTPEIAAQNGVLFSEGDQRLNDPYIAYQRYARNKKVACIGSNSSVVDALLKEVAEVITIGEDKGAFPYAAAEYLLPEQELIYLPCYVETTKELPKYLKLCSNGLTVICGPSITMSPTLFEYGAFDLSGLVVLDTEMAMESACGTGIKMMFTAGRKASLRKDIVTV